MSSQLANIQSLSSPRPPFLKIPHETRDMIYYTVFNGATLSLVFQSCRWAPGENKIYCTQKPATKLLLVSRQVPQEALTRFRFHLNADDDYCSTQNLEEGPALHIVYVIGATQLEGPRRLCKSPLSALCRLSQSEDHQDSLADDCLYARLQYREIRSGYGRRPR
ncbi:hypothetical protein LTR70_005780 [Exophiala xenobiotica]|uniref:Uncharacterized protein n=1 Tax=Lithohypha guttulata TaxID=1690604 RepID=A0ABR0JUL8_9EURO|nr:hypothetical protein LTR24_010196 [Lithohypha guttulata]KAK5317585.1 hypothetical protein LTR70_005780 [Exophiala xenobiotica]